MRTSRLILLILIITSLTALLVSCRGDELVESPAAEVNLRPADLPGGWTLEAEVDSGDSGGGDEGLASAIVGLVQTSEATSWHVRVFTQDDATLAGMIMVFPTAQASEEAMGHAPVTTILDTPKEIAELYTQVEDVVTGEEQANSEIVLEEERQEAGDEALLTWVQGGDSYALVVRKLNVICAVVGITTADGRDLAPVIAERIQ